MRKFYTIALSALLLILTATATASASHGPSAAFESGGSVLAIAGENITGMQGASTAVITVDGKGQRVGTRNLALLGSVQVSQVDTPYGPARLLEANYGAENSPYGFTLRVKELHDIKAITLQAILHNHSAKNIKLEAFDLFDTRRHVGGALEVRNTAAMLVTPLMRDLKAQTLEVSKGSLGEAAAFYAGDSGFLVGPVGPAEAYTNIQVEAGTFNAVVAMDGVQVRAGESRRSEEMILCFEPVATATKIWTRWVAATHGTRQHRGAVYGWCSWYDRTTKIDAEHVLNVTEIMEANPDTFGKGIIQIDDGYQKMDGDWSANEKFPEGMAAIAQRIRKAGHIPGVWFAPLMVHPEHPWALANPEAIQKNAKGIASFMNANPFHPAGANWINPDHPKSKEFLFNIIRDARERGFGYIKIDFNGIGNRFVDPTKTRMQIFRELYTLYREAAGEDIYILSCLGQPTRGVVGFVDAARVGPDSHPVHFEKCLKSVLRFQIYDNVWWQNDADVSYLAQSLSSRKLGPTRQGEGMWRTWHSTVALVGGTAMVSEPLNAPDAKEHWRNFEIMRPGSREPARLLTLGSSPDNSTFGFAAQRPYGNFAVYNLYNSTEGTKSLTLDFKEAGLPQGVKCAVYDFWEGRVIDYATDSYTTAPLEYHSSALLRFTPLRGELPLLVGSNLHLSIGATEVDNLRVSTNRVVIDFNNDAGARNGALVFHSSRPLRVVASENCEVSSIDDLGENLWQVNLTGRKWGQKQSLELQF
jgi:hypothetical protein